MADFIQLVPDLANTLLSAYAIKRGFDYLTSRLQRVGAEPVVIERRTEAE